MLRKPIEPIKELVRRGQARHHRPHREEYSERYAIVTFAFFSSGN